MTIHVVTAGETVFSIANQYGVSVEGIEVVNQLQYPYTLVQGQAILINTGEVMENKRSIYINGYAYPFISRWVLNATLPYLSYLSVFSYGFTTEGDLIYPMLDDSFMVSAAYEYSATPVLTLTPLGPDGRFSNALIHALVNSNEVMDNLINQLKQVMSEKGFGAVDVDFEYILAEDRDLFTAFVRRLVDELNPLGYQVFVALAPKTSANQPGLLYEGKDYRALGEIANAVLLMTYEWGYTYGPPMAVAPINMVRRVVEYAITEIPVEKINLGIPNYGYDWTLPYMRGVSKATTIGNVEAVQIALQNNAVIEFDELAQTPYFYYTQNGLEHVVWFEDVRSLSAKFDLIDEFSLRGAGYWTVMQWFRANWELLASRFNIIKNS